MTVKIAVAGASGYAGGELLRLLLAHPEVGMVYADLEVVDGDGGQLHPSLWRAANLMVPGYRLGV